MTITEKNNIFLSAWYNATYDYIMMDSIREDGLPFGSVPTFHHFAYIMMGLYPDNTIFKKFMEEQNMFKHVNERGVFQGIFNHTLWEAKMASYFGTYLADIPDETNYYQTEIKKGDIILVNLKNQQRGDVLPQMYVGDGYMIGHTCYELEPISNIVDSPLTETGTTLVGVLRYNFNRLDSQTPSGVKDIEIWEDFWDEEYVDLNTFSYNQDHGHTAARELIADIDITDNIVSIDTDISPIPTLQDFSEIWLLNDCLVCFKDHIAKEKEYTKNSKFLKSFRTCAGVGYLRYNWTLRFDKLKYDTIKNYLESESISYEFI